MLTNKITIIIIPITIKIKKNRKTLESPDNVYILVYISRNREQQYVIEISRWLPIYSYMSRFFLAVIKIRRNRYANRVARAYAVRERLHFRETTNFSSYQLLRSFEMDFRKNTKCLLTRALKTYFVRSIFQNVRLTISYCSEYC